MSIALFNLFDVEWEMLPNPVMISRLGKFPLLHHVLAEDRRVHEGPFAVVVEEHLVKLTNIIPVNFGDNVLCSGY